MNWVLVVLSLANIPVNITSYRIIHTALPSSHPQPCGVIKLWQHIVLWKITKSDLWEISQLSRHEKNRHRRLIRVTWIKAVSWGRDGLEGVFGINMEPDATVAFLLGDAVSSRGREWCNKNFLFVNLVFCKVVKGFEEVGSPLKFWHSPKNNDCYFISKNYICMWISTMSSFFAA